MVDTPIPDDDHGADLPMNMTASVMLTGLPRDAHQALADVEAIDAGKGKASTFNNFGAYILSTISSLSTRVMLELTTSLDDPVLLTQLSSDGPLPATPIGPHSQKPGLQDQRIAKVRDRGQVPSQKAGLQRDRLGLLLC